jgi:hypothetical protein
MMQYLRSKLAPQAPSKSLTTEQFEHVLGKVLQGWNENFEGKKLPFYVLETEFDDTGELRVFSTFGLSDYKLVAPGESHTVRQEFVVAVEGDSNCAWVPQALQIVGHELLASRQPILRGEVTPELMQFRDDRPFCCLYFSDPLFLDEEKWTFTSGPQPVYLSGAYPVSLLEARYALEHGWRKFEQLLETSGINPWRLDRAELCGN